MAPTNQVASNGVRQAKGASRRAGPSGGGDRYKKLTINLTPDVFERLKRYADSRDLTITELIKRALTLEEIIYSHRRYQWIFRDPETGREFEIVPVLGGMSAAAPIPT